VIRKHDAARAEPDPRGHRSDVGDQDLRDGRRDTRHVVVLRIPEPRVAEPIDCLGKFGGSLESSDAASSLHERNEVERRERESFAVPFFAW